MNSYDNARIVEAKALTRLSPFIEEKTDGRLVMVQKGKLAKYLQEVAGDIICNMPNGSMWTIELKAEEKWTANLFFETWSNRNLDSAANHAEHGSNVGWLFKSRADLLFYYFLNTDKLYIANLFKLMQWAFVDGNLYKYKEVKQAKYSQRNDTWGRLAPISHLIDEIQMKAITVGQVELFDQTLDAA